MIYTGRAGPTATYEYDTDTRTLTVSGTGKIDDSMYKAALVPVGADVGPVKVVIGKGIVEIGQGVFRLHSTIAEVSLPEGLEIIGDYAFGTSSLSGTLRIPASVTNISNPDNIIYAAEGLDVVFEHGCTKLPMLNMAPKNSDTPMGTVIVPSTVTGVYGKSGSSPILPSGVHDLYMMPGCSFETVSETDSLPKYLINVSTVIDGKHNLVIRNLLNIMGYMRVVLSSSSAKIRVETDETDSVGEYAIAGTSSKRFALGDTVTSANISQCSFRYRYLTALAFGPDLAALVLPSSFVKLYAEDGTTLLDPASDVSSVAGYVFLQEPTSSGGAQDKYVRHTGYVARFLDVSGEVWDAVRLAEGEVVDAPPTGPHRDGYEFAGWSPAVPETMPASDLSFTPTYTAVPPETVRLTVGARTGGSVSATGLDVVPGTTFSTEGPVLTLSDGQSVVASPSDGYAFTKWTRTAGTVDADAWVTAVFNVVGTYGADDAKNRIAVPTQAAFDALAAKLGGGAEITVTVPDMTVTVLDSDHDTLYSGPCIPKTIPLDGDEGPLLVTLVQYGNKVEFSQPLRGETTEIDISSRLVTLTAPSYATGLVLGEDEEVVDGTSVRVLRGGTVLAWPVDGVWPGDGKMMDFYVRRVDMTNDAAVQPSPVSGAWYKRRGSGTFTVPMDGKYILIIAGGSGGGGAGGSPPTGATSTSGCGGNAGAQGSVKAYELTWTKGTTFNWSVGAGGTGGKVSSTSSSSYIAGGAGGAGGTTTFGSYSAAGGSGGAGGAGRYRTGYAGSGGNGGATFAGSSTTIFGTTYSSREGLAGGAATTSDTANKGTLTENPESYWISVSRYDINFISRLGCPGCGGQSGDHWGSTTIYASGGEGGYMCRPAPYWGYYPYIRLGYTSIWQYSAPDIYNGDSSNGGDGGSHRSSDAPNGSSGDGGDPGLIAIYKVLE